MTVPYQYHSKIKTSSSNIIENRDYFSIFKDKLFWISDKQTHKEQFIKSSGNCCFNHIIGLPVKNGIEHPIYDYELDVIEKIQNHRNVWIKKASGIGATELILKISNLENTCQ